MGFKAAVVACLLAIAPWSVAKPLQGDGVIYQAFNQRFDLIRDRVPKLQRLGYTYIQVSPPIKTIDKEIWWGRYQPVDYRVIEGPLGNEDEFRSLISRAHRYSLKIIVDVVLNHMADPVFYGNDLNFPEFSHRDFHHPDSRPCIDNYRDRYQTTHHWLCDPDPELRHRRLPDLDTSSSYVRKIHKQFLRRMLALGVDGFRIDAAKHIEPEYFDHILPTLGDRFYYGEVIGTSHHESGLYKSRMTITDFHLLSTMIKAFSIGGSLQQLIYPEGFGAALHGHQVVFARNHDTAMHKGFFNFGDTQDVILANAYLLGKGVGTPMIYRDEYSHPAVVAGVRFFNLMRGKGTEIRGARDLCASCDRDNLLFIGREGVGLTIINKSNQWQDHTALRVPLETGCYKELQHKFPVTVSAGGDGQHWVHSWNDQPRGGFVIGPRSALFLKKTSSSFCN